MSAVVFIFVFSLQFTKWPQILNSMLQGQCTVALQEQCPIVFGSHITRITFATRNAKCRSSSVTWPAEEWLRWCSGKKSKRAMLWAAHNCRVKEGVLAAARTHTHTHDFAGWVPKVNSGDLQPLICIVDITIAQVFPVKPWLGTDKGNLLDGARWGIRVGSKEWGRVGPNGWRRKGHRATQEQRQH